MSDYSIRFNVYNDSLTGHANVTFISSAGKFTVGANIESGYSLSYAVSKFGPADGKIVEEKSFEHGRSGVSSTVDVTQAEFNAALGWALSRVDTNHNYGLVTDACNHFAQEVYERAGFSGGFGELFSNRDLLVGTVPIWKTIPDAPLLAQGIKRNPYVDSITNIIYSIDSIGELIGQIKNKCFPAGTVIHCEGENKPIENIKNGTSVLSYCPQSKNGRNQPVSKLVSNTFTNITEEWLRLTWFENGEHKELLTTPGHQFLDAHGGFRKIESIVVGGQGVVVLADGSEAEVKSESIVYSAETADMFEQAEGYVYPENGNTALKPVYKKGWRTYNFEVEDFHTYVAGGVRVHNDSWNDGKGVEFHKESYSTGNAYAVTDLEGIVPIDGRALATYRFKQDSSYDSTAQGRAEAAAFGAAAAGGTNREVSAAAWSEYKAKSTYGLSEVDAKAWTSAFMSARDFSRFEASIKHGREKGRDYAAAASSASNRDSGRDVEGSKVDTSRSWETGVGKGGLGDYDNDGEVSAREFNRAEAEGRYGNSSGNNDSDGESGGGGGGQGKPVLLDLDGDGLEVTALDRSSVFLDTEGDGFLRRTAWAGEGDGILYFDPDGRDEITEKRQFVFTEWDPTATSDLEALASVFDSNGDGVLSSSDTDFTKFKLMVTNADGSTVSKTLAELGITELDLTADATHIELSDGSVITGQTTFKRSDGTTGTAGDMLLATEVQGHRVEQVETTDGSGNRVLTSTAYAADGSKAYEIQSVTSPDGLNITNRYDDNGDGVTDRIQTIVTVVNPDGSRTETETNLSGSEAASAVLETRIVTTTSADGKVETIERDMMGGGWYDQREVRTEHADGSRTIEISDLAQDGSVITSRSETVSIDGLTRIDGADQDGDGLADTTVTHTVTIHADDSRTETVATTNRDGSQRSHVQEDVSADGRTKTILRDLDGDGDTDTREELVITVAADGQTTSVLDVRNGDGSLRSSSTTLQSDDALTRTTQLDQDGDGDIDVKTVEATVIDVDDSRETTVTVTNTDGSVRSMTRETLGADKVSSTTWADLNQNGSFEATDLVSSVVIDDTTSDRIELSYARNTDGSVNAVTTSTTSADGLTQTITTDADGDNDTDLTVSDVTVLNGDGTSTRTVTTRNQDASLRTKSEIITSADGLTVTTRTDVDGDGQFEEKSVDSRVLESDGGTTRTTSSFAGDETTLLAQTVVHDSADRRVTTITTDRDGDGNTDNLTVRSEGSDGAVTLTETVTANDGTVLGRTVTSTSANGLVSETAVDVDGDLAADVTRKSQTVLNADGSQTTTQQSENADLTLRSASSVTVSDDGLVTVTGTDRDGDGTEERVVTSTSVLENNGGTTTTVESRSANNSLLSLTRTEVSDDGLVTVNRSDADGDGSYDLVETITTTLNADGSTETVNELRDGAGVLRSKSTQTVSDNARSVLTEEDVDGDGLTDFRTTQTIADTGIAEALTQHLASDGSLQNQTRSVTSANGLVAKSETDANGDGTFETVTTATRVLNADGSETVTTELKGVDGTLWSSSTATTGDDGLSSGLVDDMDGDGSADRTTARQTVIAADGTVTSTTDVTARSGALVEKTVETASGDGRTTSLHIDRDGDGQNDEEMVITVGNDGTTTTTSSYFAASGALLAGMVSAESGTGLSRTVSYDLDGDGADDRTLADTTVLGSNGSRTRTIEHRDGQGGLLAKEQVITSDDGLATTVSLDLDGDGTFETATALTTVFAGDGSTLENWETRDTGGTLTASQARTSSGDGLLVTQSTDFDADGSADRITSLQLGASGGSTETESFHGAGGTLLRSSTTSVSADGRTTTSTLDRDGDGSDDLEMVTQVDLSRTETTTYTDRAGDGSADAVITKTTSGNGMVQSYAFDIDGDGSADITRVTTVSFDAAGNEISVFEERNADGELEFSSTTTTSANGLTSKTVVDSDGDGETDNTEYTVTTLNADGSTTTGSKDWFANGVTRSSFEETVSADGRTVTRSYDFDGDGAVDKTMVSETGADGSLTVTETAIGDVDAETRSSVTTTSSDGLVTTILRDGVEQTITRSPTENGSYSWDNGVTASETQTHILVSHTVDGLGLETWEVRETVNGVSTVFTQTFDDAAKARLLAEAARIYDSVFDRDMDLSEIEVLVRFALSGQLDRAALADALLNSDEYEARYGILSDTGFIARLYHNTLGREPSLDELEDHLADLTAGTKTRAQIAAELAESAEHLVVGNGHTETNNHDVFLMDVKEEDKLQLSFDQSLAELETNDASILIGSSAGETLDGTGYGAVYGQSGDDTLNGAVEASSLVGGDGDDTLKGNTGDDNLSGGSGNDRLEGGDGEDTYYYERGDGDDVILDTGSGDNGDTLLFGKGISAEDLNIGYSGDDLLITFFEQSEEDKYTANAVGLPPLTGSIRIENWATSLDGRIEMLSFADGTSIDLAKKSFIMASPKNLPETLQQDSIVTLVDLNNDGNLDKIESTDDGSIWTRLGDGQGGFSAAQAQGRDLATNVLEKTGGGNTSSDRWAYSAESFTGAGILTTTVVQTDKIVTAGLSSGNREANWSSIDYAIHEYAGTLRVFESGTDRGSFGNYAVGDELSIERLSDGTVRYLKNGEVFYTSGITSDPSIALRADATFHHLGGRLGDTSLQAGSAPAALVTWEPDQDVSLVSANITVSTSYEDLNDDDIVDAILASDDGSIWTRLGDGQGGFGAAQVQGRDLATNAIQKVGGTHGQWDRGAYSEEGLVGAGALTTTVALTNRSAMLGLSADPGDSGYHSIDYTLLQNADGTLRVYESGVHKGTFGNYHIGDELGIERLADGTVQYLKNGLVFYTSSLVSDIATTLYADASLHYHSSRLGDTYLRSGSGEDELITWVADPDLSIATSVGTVSVSYEDLNDDDIVDAILASDDGSIWTRLGDGQGGFGTAQVQGRDLATNAIQKVGGTHGQWDRGAYSEEGLVGAGALTTTVALTNRSAMLGLSADPGDSGYHSIDYTLLQNADGTLRVYESGVHKGTFGNYHIGDELGIERLADGTVQYLKNGLVFYTSSLVSDIATTLYADASLHYHSSRLGDTYLRSGSGEDELITWVADPDLSIATSVGTVSVSYEDLNDDDIVDAVLTSDDGSIWTRLGDGQGGFGAAVAQGRDLATIVLEKTGGSNTSSDRWAYSQESFTGAGVLTTTVIQSNKQVTFGLSSGDRSTSWSSIEYAIYEYAGTLRVFEGGTDKGSFGSYVVGDQLSIERLADGTVQYLKNGVVFYTSLVVSDPATEMRADTAFHHLGARLGDTVLQVGGASPDLVTWDHGPDILSVTADGPVSVSYEDLNGDNIVDAVLTSDDGSIWTRLGDGQGGFGEAEAQGRDLATNVLEKTGGSNTSSDRWAYSQESFTGAGVLTTTVIQSNKQVTFGLSSGDRSTSWSSIEYAIYEYAGTLRVFEGGTDKGSFGSYVVGDQLSIERLADGTVQYLKNGVVFYTSLVVSDPATEMRADTAFHHLGARLGDTVLQVGGASPDLVTWDHGPDILSVTADGPVSVSYEDLNGDNIVDAVLTSDDGSIWTRLGDGQGGFGEAEAQGRDLATNVLEKTGGSNTSSDRWAYSQESFTGAGVLTTTVIQSNKQVTFGLSSGDRSTSWSSIEYAIYEYAGTLRVFEGGTDKGSFGSYVVGDQLSIERLADGTVQYLKNGVVFYTSLVVSDPATEMRADTAFHHLGARLGDTVLQVGGASPDLVTWDHGPDILSVTADGPVSVSYEDLNGDNIVDAVLTSDDGSIWTRLGDGQGGFGAAEKYKDEVIGSNDDDLINTRYGNDTVSAGDGDDVVHAGAGNDIVDGGEGNDRLFGAAGNDTLRGQDGDDVLFGEGGNDVLEGGADQDTLEGGAGDDTLQAGDGSDVLIGGTGDDRQEGGAGDDTYVYNRGDGHDAILDTGSAENGDILVFGAGISVDHLTLSLSGSNLLIGFLPENAESEPGSTNAGLPSLEGSITIEGWTTASKRIERIAFDNGDSFWIGHLTAFNNDVSSTQALTGGTANEWLAGFGGSDLLKGGSGHDLIQGGIDDDTLEGQDGHDVLLGGAGNDSLSGGKDDDVLDAGRGNANAGWQTLIGGEGDDQFVLRRDNGRVSITEVSGEGDDTLIFSDLNIADLSISTYDYSSGSDNPLGMTSETEPDALVLAWSNGVEAGEYWLNDGGQHFETISFADGSTIKSISSLQDGSFDLTGTDDDDIIVGSAGNDVIKGGAGKDTVSAGAGNDEVHYSLGDQFWTDYEARDVGGEGTDTLIVEAGSGFVTEKLSDLGFEIFKGAELDDRVTGNLASIDYHLDGGAGNDVLTGGSGSDTLIGGEGADQLEVGAGVAGKEQSADGGAGNDTYIIRPETSYLWITEDPDGAVGGSDTLQFIDISQDQLEIEVVDDPVLGIFTQISWGDAANGKWVRFTGSAIPVEQFSFTTTEAQNAVPYVTRDLALNALEKVDAGSNWNRGAHSVDGFTGAGSMSTTVAQTNKSTIVGVSASPVGDDRTSVEYGIYTRSDKYFFVFESGIDRGNFGTYSVGDVFTVDRLADGTVQYLKNGIVFYTSTLLSDPTLTLHADASIYHVGGRIGDTVLQSGNEPAQLVSWSHRRDLMPVETDSSITTIHKDLNGDNVVDAVLTSDDGSIWTRLGDGQGGFGEAEAQGRDLATNVLEKTGGSNTSSDRWAYSQESFTGAGVLTTTVIQSNKQVTFGLSSGDRSTSWSSIEYAIYEYAGTLRVFEGGTDKGSFGSYVVGDQLSIERLADGTVQYLKNGVVFYTSLVVSDPATEMRADTAFHHLGARLGDTVLQVGGASPDLVTWDHGPDILSVTADGPVSVSYEDLNGDNIVDAVLTSDDGSIWTRLGDGQGGFGEAEAQGRDLATNVLEKTGGSNTSSDRWAYSQESFTGAGVLTTTVIQSNKQVTFGLSSGDRSTSWSSIEYAIYEYAGTLRVFEGGTDKGSFGSYVVGDQLSIERLADGTVQYLKNGVVFYTSLVVSDPATEMRADTAFHHLGARLGDTVLQVGGASPDLVTWDHGPDILSVTADGPVSVSYEDLNGDNIVDAVLTSDDGSIWTRLGDGQGGFGAAEAQGRDFASNVLEKTGGTHTHWDRGAYSQESFTGAGALTVTATNPHKTVQFGLSSNSQANSGTDMDYAIRQTGLEISVYENNAYVGTFGTYTVGDELVIERLADGTVHYYQNGSVFYTSTVLSDPSVELRADVSLPHFGSRVGEAVLAIGNEPAKLVTWVKDSGVIDVNADLSVSATYEDLNGDNIVDVILAAQDGSIWTRLGDGQGGFGAAQAQGRDLATNVLEKVGGSSALWDRGAYAEDGFVGAGSLSTTAHQTNKSLVVGLSASPGDLDRNSIEFGIYLRSDKKLFVFESGSDKGTFGTYAIGDVLTVERLADGSIQYLKNGIVFYTSAASSDPASTLRADASLYHIGTRVGETVLQEGNSTPEHVAWVHNRDIVKIGTDGAVSTTYEDLNGDNIVDAVLTSEDGSIWTRLGDGQGGFGAAEAQGRDFASNVLEKTGGTHTHWDRGAYSQESFTGAGALTVTATNPHKTVQFGLSSNSQANSGTGMDYAIRQTGLEFSVYENNAYVGTFGSYTVDDELTIERQADGTVHYYRNGLVFYTSTVLSDPSVELRADVSLPHFGSRVGEAALTIGIEPAKLVTWVKDSGVIDVNADLSVSATYEDLNGDNIVDVILAAQDGSIWTRLGDGQGGFGAAQAQGRDLATNVLEKVGGSSALWDRGAYAEDGFVGAGSLSTTAHQTNKSLVVGLSASPGDLDRNSIEFGIYLRSDKKLFVFESGSDKGTFGTYAIGDVLTVERLADGSIQYLKNGIVFYTSAASSDPASTLLADASLYHIGTRVGETVLQEGNSPPEHVAWVHNRDIVKIGTDGAVSTTYEDLNGDNIVDAVLTSEDGSIWTRLGDGQGGFGAAEAQGRDFASNVLEKTGGTHTHWDRGAYSQESFTGAGALTVTATGLNTHVQFGLSLDSPSSSGTNMDYAIRQDVTELRVYEKNVHVGTFGGFANGDELTIERLADGTVQYLRNGDVFYTSTTLSDPTASLRADVSLRNTRERLGEAVLKIGDEAEKLVTWVKDTGVSDVNADLSVSATYVDLNGDNLVDVILAAEDGSIWTRLGDGQGGFDEANLLQRPEGNETLSVVKGTDNNDALNGSSAAEFLIGGSGDDTLNGDGGNDVLVGGSGSDTFVFTSFGAAAVAVTDFDTSGATGDLLQFESSVFADFNAVLLAVTDDGSDTTITLDADSLVVLKSVLVPDLQSDDFSFV